MFKKRLNSKIDSRASVRLVDEQREILLRMKGRKRMLKKNSQQSVQSLLSSPKADKHKCFVFKMQLFLLQVLDYLLWFLFHTFH